MQYVSSHEFIFSFPVSLSRSQQVFFSFNYFMFFMCHFFAYIKREKKAHIKVSGRHTQKSQLHSLVLLRTENGEGKGEKKKIEAKHVKTYVWKVFANNRTATNTLEIFARTRAISSITWNKSFADFPIFFSLSLYSFDEIIKKKSQNTSFSVHTQPKLFYDYIYIETGNEFVEEKASHFTRANWWIMLWMLLDQCVALYNKNARAAGKETRITSTNHMEWSRYWHFGRQQKNAKHSPIE